MHRGFILITFFIIFTFGAVFILAPGLFKPPPAKTQETAQTIFKYPKSQSWQIINKKSLCTNKLFQCQSQSKIRFKSDDAWPAIYGYYKTHMVSYGWTTNSLIITSIPDGIVFTNTQNCQAYLTKSSRSTIDRIFGKGDSKTNEYSITVTCKD